MEQRAQLRPPQWLTRTERQLTATEAAAWLEKTPKLNKRAKYMFQGWKMSMCETWNLLEDRRLPDEGSNSPVLQQILEPAKQEADGEAEGASPTVQSIKAAWDALEWSTRKRRAEWPYLMQAALRACPDHAHLVFLATFDVKVVPSYMAETTIDFLLHMRESERTVQPARPFDVLSEQDLLAVLRHVLENSPHGYLRVRQSSFYLLIRILGSSLDDLVSLYHELVKYEHPLHKYTRLQIAGKLANSPDPKHKTLAISVLETTLAETDLDINAPQSAALCTAILTSSESGLAKTGAAENGSEPSTSAATPAELFDVLLQRGFEPNLITYTTIIRGLCLKQELDPAIQVLQLILNETKTEPDAYVYSILMNGAKMGCNYPIIQEVARSAAARVIRHPFLWNDFLQAIYLTALNEARQDPEARRPRVVPAFPLMVQAYARVFELAPLRKLFPNINLDLVAAADRGRAPYDSGTTDWSRRNQMGGQQNIVSGKNWEFSEQLAPTVRILPQLSSAELVEPTESTLATMVLGYIQSLSNPYDVISFYTHFRHLLQTGDPMAVRLVQNRGSKVHDIVVMALVQFDGMLRAALDVVSDMLRDAAASLEAGNTRAPTSASASASAGPAGPAGPSSVDMDAAGNGFHPPPSVYTWSILVNGFMLHRQHNQAESVINMMRERGIEPNLVTWNSLLAGYARSQKASNVMKTFERLEASGQEPDDFTYRGLSYLSNQTSVVRQLESRQAQAAKAAEEASSQAAFDAAFSADDAAFKVSQPTDGAASSPPVSHSGHEHGSISSPSHRVDKDLGRLGHSGARTKRRELTYDLDELNRLEGEVAEIAKMMDEEQEDGKKGSE
ncbi:hypothetical protein Sste5346_000536 [Sporothrix stenoceras]|uniref:Pentatricopeptide repeat protein n=1 Tax=Sporothrix stenoceras TaxID=5173 RepID=A0ABR3ZSV3_9PEZI